MRHHIRNVPPTVADDDLPHDALPSGHCDERRAERREEHRGEPDTDLDALFDKMRPERIERLRRVVGRRMKGLTVVLEDLYDAGNRSAVYRSAEAFGVRDVHVIRPETATKPHARAVSRGAEKWIDIQEWEDTERCVAALQRDGFAVFAADLRAARPLQTIDFGRPVALVFGSEQRGITDAMRRAVDGTFVIPMAGFTSSFNVSVAASIALQHARVERERALGAETDLDAHERARMLHDFAERSSRWLRRTQKRGVGKEEGLKSGRSG